MATIKFYLQSKNNPAGIYVRLRDGAKVDAKAKTKFAINSSDWSTIKGRPKNLGDASFKKLDAQLVEFKTDLLSHFNSSVGKEAINSDWLKEFITPTIQPSTITNKLTEYFDYYALHKKSTMRPSSHTKLSGVKHLIERFQKENKVEYLIKDVDADFKLRFEQYCLKENYAPNTIARVIKFIKTICYHARNNHGIYTSIQLNNITVKLEKVEKVFLSADELKLIEEKELEHDYHINARDWLLLSCETAQRVSDFMRFTKEQIRYDGEIPLIEFTQVKTNKRMTIPLNAKVMAILKKRNGNFPKQMTDQRYNKYIKDVCQLAGLTYKIKGSKINKEILRKETGTFEKWELVSSHIGRRSFATNYYGIIPTSLLIYMTGHSTEKMFLEYIGKTETESALQLAKYFYSNQKQIEKKGRDRRLKGHAIS